MICLDKPRDYGGKFMGCSHLFSDLLDQAAAERELRAFAVRVGLAPTWIQYPSTVKVHFDVFGGPRQRCAALGAREVTDEEAVAIWRAQRERRHFAV